MLRVEQLNKSLGDFALQGVDFTLPQGCIMGLIGENGAGKTTLLHLLSGVYMPERGHMTWDGQDYGTDESAWKDRIGVVLHEELFLNRASLVRNGTHYGSYYSRYDGALFREYLERFELKGRMRYGQLSKGGKLKFALAFALAHKPQLLLLDEPTANLDTQFRGEFRKVLREYTDLGGSVILSTHMMQEVDHYADYVLMLHRGRQLLCGDIETIRGDYRMTAGEPERLRQLDGLIYMEESDYSCKALVRRQDAVPVGLSFREPTAEELVYFMIKGARAHE